MNSAEQAANAEACLGVTEHYGDMELRNFYVAQRQVHALLASAAAIAERG